MSNFWKSCGVLVALPVLAVVLTTTACSTAEPLPAPWRPIPAAKANLAHTPSIVTTSNIIADWVRQVGGDQVEIFALLPVGADPHTFQPGARDIARVADADLIISVGMALEANWLERLVKNAAADSSQLIALGEIVDPIVYESDNQKFSDPHFWLDPVMVKKAVSEIAARLSALDQATGDTYQANASAYNQELDALHAWIQRQVKQIPPERRVLVTSHDSFGYFAHRYEFTIVNSVIPGFAIELEPSAAELTKLVEQIRDYQAQAIFTETTVSDRLARTIAEEAGINATVPLYAGSLGAPGSDSDTYISMMETNIEAIMGVLT